MQLAGMGADCWPATFFISLLFIIIICFSQWAKNIMKLGARVGMQVGPGGGTALKPKGVEAAMQQQ